VCNELLRHFWGCLPLRGSAAREKRASKLKDTLDAKYTQLERMQVIKHVLAGICLFLAARNYHNSFWGKRCWHGSCQRSKLAGKGSPPAWRAYRNNPTCS